MGLEVREKTPNEMKQVKLYQKEKAMKGASTESDKYDEIPKSLTKLKADNVLPKGIGDANSTVTSLTDNVVIIRQDTNPDVKDFYNKLNNLEIKDYKITAEKIDDGGKESFEIVITKKMDKVSPQERQKEDKQLMEAAKKNPAIFEEFREDLKNHIFYVQQGVIKDQKPDYKLGTILTEASEEKNAKGFYKYDVTYGLDDKSLVIQTKSPYLSPTDILKAIHDSTSTGKKEFFY